MNNQGFFHAGRVALMAALVFAVASSAGAFSILGHRVIALRVLHAVRTQPDAYPEFLSKIAADETLTRYFLGGTDAPDLGAIDGLPRPNIQYSTHYEHPGLWIKTLFALARDDNERAYAWGWVVHEGADLQVHPWMDAHGLNYCDVGLRHTFFEAMMDGDIGSTFAEYSDEGVHGQSLHAARLLREARRVVRGAKARSSEYDRYLEALHKRCKTTGALADAKDEEVSASQFDAARDLELAIGEAASSSVEAARQLRQEAPTNPVAFAFASALEIGKKALPELPRTADNAEMVGLYGFATGKIQQMLRAAAAGDWAALDLNFDTAAAVHDPSLGSERRLPVIDIALVLDASGSMKENDPNGLRKRAAELLIDRSPEAARFTIVRFNQDVAVLATRSTDRAQLRQAIHAIGASGGTRLCKAAYATLDILAAEEAAEKAIVLLTDGLSQDNCDPAALARRGVRIFTVGLSPQANGGLLQAIAAGTDASYVHARTAADVQSVFDIMIAQVLHESAVADFSGTALPGQTSRFRLPVDPSVTAMTVLLTWPGSTLDLTLLSPSGKRLNASIEGRTAGTYEMLHLDAPESGTWTAAVKSIEVAAAGEPFRLRAAADTPIRLHLIPIESKGAPAMRATLEGFPSTAAHVRARVERPDGKIDDAGLEQDGRSFVARYARADIPGAYNFVWSALAGGVNRVATRSIFIGETAIQGGTVQSVEGQYVRWNRGSLHGIRHGLPVRIVRQGQVIGSGRAIDVRSAESDIEIDSVSGVAEINVGDEVLVEMGSWVADAIHP